jgi:hypothetical protein
MEPMLRNHLPMGIGSQADLLDSPLLGSLWETLVFSEFRRLFAADVGTWQRAYRRGTLHLRAQFLCPSAGWCVVGVLIITDFQTKCPSPDKQRWGQRDRGILGMHPASPDKNVTAENQTEKHQRQNRDGEQPPVPFHPGFLVRGSSEFPGGKLIVIKIVVRQIQAVIDFIVFPGAFRFRRGGLFPFRATFAGSPHPNLTAAGWADVCQVLWHVLILKSAVAFLREGKFEPRNTQNTRKLCVFG